MNESSLLQLRIPTGSNDYEIRSKNKPEKFKSRVTAEPHCFLTLLNHKDRRRFNDSVGSFGSRKID